MARDMQRLSRQDTAELDALIVSVKREQRQFRQLQAGEVLNDRYELLEVIGTGGFARIWQAYDLNAGQLVAVKILHAESSDEPRRIERFNRGARQMKELRHPNILRVLEDPTEYLGFHYFVMDYYPGGDLSQALTSGTIDRHDALRALMDIGAALAYAHSRHVIHRDVKPMNILLDGLGKAYLADFDLVWAANTTGGTRPGSQLGTYLYAPPEQDENAESVDERADVYSLGMTTFFVIFGKKLTRRVTNQLALSIDKLDCEKPVKDPLHRATAYNPEDRPASIHAFCSQLANLFGDFLSWQMPLLAPALSHAVQLFAPARERLVLPSSAAKQTWLIAAPVEPTSALASTPTVPHFLTIPSKQEPVPIGCPQAQKVPPSQAIDIRDKTIDWAKKRSPAILLALGVAMVLVSVVWSIYRPVRRHLDSQAVRTLVEAQSDLQAKRWVDAINKIRGVMADFAISSNVKDTAQQSWMVAQREINAQLVYERFVSACRGSDEEQALNAFRDIPIDSSYQQIAVQQYNEVLSRFITRHLGAAEAAYEQHKCAELRSHVDEILRVAPKHTEALDIGSRRCDSPKTPSLHTQPTVGTHGPRVSAGTCVILGLLDGRRVPGIISNRTKEVKTCYKQGLIGNPKLQGLVSVALTIDDNGVVQFSRLRSSTLHNPNVEQCIIGFTRNWKFPKAQSGYAVVTCPFDLKPPLAR